MLKRSGGKSIVTFCRQLDDIMGGTGPPGPGNTSPTGGVPIGQIVS
jgi:hypothetical protein